MGYINMYSKITLCVLIDALYGHDNCVQLQRLIRMKYKRIVNKV